MDMYRIHDMLEDVSEAATTELAKGTEQVNTKEFVDVVDMIKDLTEAEKNAGCTFKWLPMTEALDIFGHYEDFHKTNIADYGLYRREYYALIEFSKR